MDYPKGSVYLGKKLPGVDESGEDSSDSEEFVSKLCTPECASKKCLYVCQAQCKLVASEVPVNGVKVVETTLYSIDHQDKFLVFKNTAHISVDDNFPFGHQLTMFCVSGYLTILGNVLNRHPKIHYYRKVNLLKVEHGWLIH